MRAAAFLFYCIELGTAMVVPVAVLSSTALAATDSVLCRLPYAPGLAHVDPPKPRLVLVENVSAPRPLVSFYGHQILALARSRDGASGADLLDDPASRYLFRLDTARMRMAVAPKSPANEGGRRPAIGEGVAGNCSPL